MKVQIAIDRVERSERELASELRSVAERHAADHDVYHLGHTLALHCGEHLAALHPFAERYGAHTENGDDVSTSPGFLEAVRHKASELLGRTEPAGLLLLRDLRELYMHAQEAEIDWVILMQTAAAARDPELLDVAAGCHQETESVGKWLRTRIKQTAPQVLVAG
jgi:hypothetical protein